MLRTSNLSCRFGTATAVNNVTLSIPAGQMVGIIGRSGAGKSTLLRMINRLQEPTAGKILYGGTEVTSLRGKRLRTWRTSCPMIFQQFNLMPRLDVLTNVLIGRLNHRGTISSLFALFTEEERATALAVLDRFGLASMALQRASTLSGGQQQRVAICRALLQSPAVVLADEPIASLDPGNAAVVMQTLRRINQEDGLTVLVNLHHVEAAQAYCDRIIGLSAGAVVFDGMPDELTPERLTAIYGAMPAWTPDLAVRPQAHLAAPVPSLFIPLQEGT